MARLIKTQVKKPVSLQNSFEKARIKSQLSVPKANKEVKFNVSSVKFNSKEKLDINEGNNTKNILINDSTVLNNTKSNIYITTNTDTLINRNKSTDGVSVKPLIKPTKRSNSHVSGIFKVEVLSNIERDNSELTSANTIIKQNFEKIKNRVKVILSTYSNKLNRIILK